MRKLLLEIIQMAQNKGLAANSVDEAFEFLEYHEFGLCLDTLAERIYEEDIKVDRDFFKKVVEAGKKMNFESTHFEPLRRQIT